MRLADGLSVFTDERTVAPEATQKVSWSGRARSGLALDGRYQLRVAVDGDAGASSSTAAATPGGGASPEAAAPPRARRACGPSRSSARPSPCAARTTTDRAVPPSARAARATSHQGQDVMADCGTPLVAARGGTVVMSTYQALAGNYLVIQDPITVQSNMYAHLREPAIVKRGQRVETGQPIGVVGDTGDASACHLHFEIWTSPGWYRGGEPIDPLPTLKRWDRFS